LTVVVPVFSGDSILVVPEVAGLPVVPCIDDPLVASLEGDGGLIFGSDGALVPLWSTGETATAAVGTASATATAAVARYGMRRMDIVVLPSIFWSR
jgi:hypothetical protein